MSENIVSPHGSPSDGRYLGAALGAGFGAVTGWVLTARWLWPSATVHDCLLAIYHGNLTPGGSLLPAAGGVGLGLVAGAVLFQLLTRRNEIHHRGREFVSMKKMRRSLRPQRKQTPSIPFPGMVIMSVEQECRHVLIAGSPGGGKTVALTPMIGAALDRGDHALIFSFKNDFQEIIEAPILAPWDSRSMRWAMGEDVATRADALALA